MYSCTCPQVYTYITGLLVGLPILEIDDFLATTSSSVYSSIDMAPVTQIDARRVWNFRIYARCIAGISSSLKHGQNGSYTLIGMQTVSLVCLMCHGGESAVNDGVYIGVCQEP